LSEKKYHAIVTVGTSILRNTSSEDTERACSDPKSQKCLEFLVKKLNSDPSKVSAEVNSMRTYLNEKERKIASVTLLASDTDEGKVCAEALRSFFEDRGIKAEVMVVEKLGKAFEVGTSNLMDAIAKAVATARKEGLEIILNLTGGYKAESAIAYVSALLLSVDKVLYIHETLRVPVELPALPLSIKGEELARLSRLTELNPYCKDWLEAGFNDREIEDLVDKGLVEMDGGKCKVRDIVKEILKIYES
jgi:putative CRISPR-associated protein (TIGR02619 family)